jgi:DNA invertase Pin-like site-specific DNA recombinase
MKTACAYYRTSSATNVGQIGQDKDGRKQQQAQAYKDSLKRQQAAVRSYAAAHSIEIVHEYYDAAVSGADSVDIRPGFSEMLMYMLGNGARTILVEDASRFARDLIVQETGYQMLKDQGIAVVAVDSPDSFVSDTPTAVLVRQILGAVRQFQKTELVLKLRGARNRKRRETGRCEGNPAWVKTVPEAAITAARAAKARDLTLREIGAELASAGFLNANGKPYAAQSVKRMLRAA